MVGSAKKVLSALLLLGSSCATTTPKQMPGPVPEVLLLDGSTVPWQTLLAPQDTTTLVVFATPWCEICRQERPKVEAWARAHRPPKRTVYVFSGGELPGVMDQVRAYQLDSTALTVVIDADGRLADHYAVQFTPTLLVVGAEGRVLSTYHRFGEVHLD
jgi:thiol-disulfide isomerase/thioredoxin